MRETKRGTTPRANPWRSRLLAGVAAIAGFAPRAAHAEGPNLQSLDAYIEALGSLDRHELAGLVLTLGVLGFAVTSAIVLVRTKLRASHAEAALRDEVVTL